MIYVIVQMKVKPECLEDYKTCCRELQPLVQAENGCIAYDYTVGVVSPLTGDLQPDPTLITLVERWESPEALAAHGQTAHMKDFSKKVKDMRESIVITVHEML